LLLGLLSAQPLLQQAAQSLLAAAPGALFAGPAASAGLNLFNGTAQFTAPIDFGAIGQNTPDVLTAQIPAIVNKVLSQVLTRQPSMH